MKKSTVRTTFTQLDGQRTNTLNIARNCAALTKPWVLPDESQNPDSLLPENFQSVGSYGTTNLSGMLLTALYPPDAPWFILKPSAKLRYLPTSNSERIADIANKYRQQELLMQASLEESPLNDKSDSGRGGYRYRSGFRARKRMSIDQLVVTGDTLEQLTDDYQIKVFRRDQYVTLRDSSGEVLMHIVREKIDPLKLAEDAFAKTGLNQSELMDQLPHERLQDLYTIIEWQPVSKVWSVRQEVVDKEVLESEERVSPYFSTPFELVAGEHYGRGPVELNRGDLYSLNRMEEAMIDFTQNCSKMMPVIDDASNVTPQDLTRPSGTPIVGRVQGGRVQDIAFLSVEKYADFRVVAETIQRKRKDLGIAFLIQSETAPTGEAGRSPVAWQQIATQLNGHLGGLYSTINDNQQLPLLHRLRHQLQRDKVLPVIETDAQEISVLTGIRALSQESKAGRLSQVMVAVSPFPELLKRFHEDVLLDVMLRYANVDEPGLIKSKEEYRREIQEAMNQQAQAQATEEIIKVGGDAARAAIPQPQ